MVLGSDEFQFLESFLSHARTSQPDSLEFAATIPEMKPRTATFADVTAPPEQCQLEVILKTKLAFHAASLNVNVLFPSKWKGSLHKMSNARNVGIGISGEQPARLHSRRPARPRLCESAKLCACCRTEISPGTSSAGEGYGDTILQLQETSFVLSCDGNSISEVHTNKTPATPLAPSSPAAAANADAAAASDTGIERWEAALRQLGEEGGADRTVSGVIFHYPAHFFAFFEVSNGPYRYDVYGGGF